MRLAIAVPVVLVGLLALSTYVFKSVKPSSLPTTTVLSGHGDVFQETPLEAVPEPLTPAALVGQYAAVSGTADITMTESRPGTLHVTGLATWHNADGIANTGDIDGDLALSGNEAKYSKDGCEITFTFGADEFTAEDNLRCGGMNVTFSDRYVRL